MPVYYNCGAREDYYNIIRDIKYVLYLFIYDKYLRKKLKNQHRTPIIMIVMAVVSFTRLKM